MKVLLGRFPATVWLVGSAFTSEAARRFVRERPPAGPCIAEYGQGFPTFLAGCPAAAARVPYLRAFAALEWLVGQVSLAVEYPAMSLQDLSGRSGRHADRLLDAVLTLQPGARYLRASWPIDDLMKLYMTSSAPDRLVFEPADVYLQVYGARGAFGINRLDLGEFVFRQTLAEGRSLADAAESALDATPGFDPGRALTAVTTDGLVVGIR